MNALEQDALEVLSLLRSVSNSFAPVNRIPPEIISLTLDYYDEGGTDQDLIALTHVCRGWRNMFISRPSLWTHLDFTNVDKTRTYVQRSRSSPLEIYLERDQDDTHDDALLLVAPHIRRLRSLTVRGDFSPNILKHFDYPAPHLEKLCIDLFTPDAPILDSALFGGDLSSLRELSLGGVVTTLPWNSLPNLTTFELTSCPPGSNTVTQLLKFFKCAPLLSAVTLKHSIPTSSNAPPGRKVSLPRLKTLVIIAHPAHSILLNHLHIPTGASLILRLGLNGDASPLQSCLPETLANLGNLSHITTISLRSGTMQKYMRLSGPSSELCIRAHLVGNTISSWAVDRPTLRSLPCPILSTTKRLQISRYKPLRSDEVDTYMVFRTLSPTLKLRILILTECSNLPFILALNSKKNSSKLVACPDLEELALCVGSRDQFLIKYLLGMAKERASRGVKLSSITIVGLGELVPGKEVFKLREHVTRVDYRVDNAPPNLDHLHECADEGE